jgi:hypothetical protein
MDIWVLGDPQLSTQEHLLRLVGDILQAAVPDKPWVYSDSPHHYTEGGIEVNVLNDGAPVEVLECGHIAQSLLERLQIDPLRHGGLALGMGLDRLTMLRKRHSGYSLAAGSECTGPGADARSESMACGFAFAVYCSRYFVGGHTGVKRGGVDRENAVGGW